jgi:hypothetical protein
VVQRQYGGTVPGGEKLFFEIRERLNRGLRLIANRYDGRNVMIAGMRVFSR